MKKKTPCMMMAMQNISTPKLLIIDHKILMMRMINCTFYSDDENDKLHTLLQC